MVVYIRKHIIYMSKKSNELQTSKNRGLEMLKNGEILERRYTINYFIGNENCEKYIAYDEMKNEEVEILLVEKNYKTTPDTEKRIRALLEMSYACLQKIEGFTVYKNSLFAVLEKVYGKPVSEIINKRELIHRNRIKKWYSQLIGSISYIENSNYKSIHGAITPQSIVIDENDNASLQWSKININDGCILYTNLTFPYASPEQYRKYTDFCEDKDYKKIKLDVRSDMYSLAAVFYELITFSKPNNPYEMQILISQWDVDCIKEIKEIIDKSMKYNASDRYKNIFELMKVIDRGYSSGGKYKKHGEVASKKPLIIILLSFIAVIVGIVACMFILNAGDDNNYSSYIKKAEEAVKAGNEKDAILNYKKAIEISPSREGAYNGLLDNVLLKDGYLDYDESLEIQRTITNKRLSKLKKKDEEAYYRLEYKLANAYMFLYDNQIIGCQRAYDYYELTKPAQKLSVAEMNRVNFFTNIYYIDYKNDLTEDEKVSYSKFYNELNDALEDYVDIDNDRFISAKVCEAVYQYLYKYELEFLKEDISYKEMLTTLKNTEDYLEKLSNLEEVNSVLPKSIDLNMDLKNVKYLIGQFNALNEESIENNINYDDIFFSYDNTSILHNTISCEYVSALNGDFEIYIEDKYELKDYKVIVVNGLNQLQMLDEGIDFSCELLGDSIYSEKFGDERYKYVIKIHTSAFDRIGKYSIIVGAYNTYSYKMYGKNSLYIENTRAKYPVYSSDKLVFNLDNEKPEVVVTGIEQGKKYDGKKKASIVYADMNEISEIEITISSKDKIISKKKLSTKNNEYFGNHGEVTFEVDEKECKQNILVTVKDVAGNTRETSLSVQVGSDSLQKFIQKRLFVIVVSACAILIIVGMLAWLCKVLKR